VNRASSIRWYFLRFLVAGWPSSAWRREIIIACCSSWSFLTSRAGVEWAMTTELLKAWCQPSTALLLLGSLFNTRSYSYSALSEWGFYNYSRCNYLLQSDKQRLHAETDPSIIITWQPQWRRQNRGSSRQQTLGVRVHFPRNVILVAKKFSCKKRSGGNDRGHLNWDFFSGDILSRGHLILGTFYPGTLWLRTFSPGDILSGTFYPGQFDRGHFVRSS